MQDKEFLNLRKHVFGLDTIEMCPTSRVPIVQKITADFVEWLIGEGFIWKGEWNRSKHGHDAKINDQVIEVKRIAEFHNKTKKWPNAVTINMHSGAKMQAGDKIFTCAFGEDGRLGYVLEAKQSKAGVNKSKEKNMRGLQEGEGKGTKTSNGFDYFRPSSLKVHYANRNQIEKHFTKPRKDKKNSILIKELCFKRANDPLPEVQAFIDKLKNEE